MLFVKSRGPAARCAVKQIGFGSPAVLYCSPRGRCAARGRPGFSNFGFEVAPAGRRKCYYYYSGEEEETNYYYY